MQPRVERELKLDCEGAARWVHVHIHQLPAELRLGGAGHKAMGREHVGLSRPMPGHFPLGKGLSRGDKEGVFCGGGGGVGDVGVGG